MGLYEFNPDDAYRFAKQAGAETWKKGDELNFKFCPYCHGGSNHDKGTFSISLMTGQFKCLRASCGATGNMLTLHKDFDFDLGSDISEYERPKYSWRKFKRPEKPFESDDKAIQYLTSRKISEDVVRRYEIKTDKRDDNKLVFPFYDDAGDLVFVKYRFIEKPEGVGKEFCEKNCRAILFGMKQCNLDKKNLIITEGQIDSLSVATAGFENAVSVPLGKNGFTWIPHCWDWLKQFDSITVFGDLENGKMSLLDEIRRRFTWMRVKAVREEDYQGCKDANEILQKYGADAVRNAVNHAQPLMSKRVLKLSQVKRPDAKMRLQTGIAELDNTLSGGLPFGYLHILTGKRGEGKSTFGTMLVKAAIEQGYPVFIYSGEMDNGDVQEVIDRQIAGPHKIRDKSNGQGPYPVYDMEKADVDRIHTWYDDFAFIYDSSELDEESEETDLIETIETYIVQFGCKFILVDNLMTGIDLVQVDNAEKYQKQEIFCKRLARLARRYNIIVLLVAHKRKDNVKYVTDENDDVLGSSEITNLAGAVISYGRPKANEDGETAEGRIIKVTKERVEGHINMDGISVGYDPASKRIFGNTIIEENVAKMDGVPFQTGVEKKSDAGATAADDMEVPF